MAEVYEINSDSALIEELAAVLRSVVEANGRTRRGGVTAPFAWIVAHCDDDPALARRVLLAAQFAPETGGLWRRKTGLYDLSEIDREILGDVLTDVLDSYRPLAA